MRVVVVDVILTFAVLICWCVGVSDYLFIKVPGCSVYEVAADGVYYESPRLSTSLVLVVGSRKDILVRCDFQGLFAASSSNEKALLNSYIGKGTTVYEGKENTSILLRVCS